MAVFAVFAADGLPPAAFYDTAVHDPDAIPDEAVAIDAETRDAFCAGGKRWDGTGLVPFAPPAIPPGPRTATGRQLRYALNRLGVRAAWDQAVAGRAGAGKPDDADYWMTLGSGDLAPETSPKLARIAAAASPAVDLAALYDAALAPG